MTRLSQTCTSDDQRFDTCGLTAPFHFFEIIWTIYFKISMGLRASVGSSRTFMFLSSMVDSAEDGVGKIHFLDISSWSKRDGKKATCNICERRVTSGEWRGVVY